MRELVIFGDSQFAERLYQYIKLENQARIIAFTQEKQYITRNNIEGIPVIDFDDLHTIDNKFEILIAVGYSMMNDLRRKIYNLCESKGYPITTYISSRALIYTKSIADGNFISPGVIIGPNTRIGTGNFFESGVILSHDNVIGDFNYFSSNSVFGGFTEVGDNSFFGLNSTIKDNIQIENYTIVGSASNVLKSVEEEGSVLVGNPAKKICGKFSKDLRL